MNIFASLDDVKAYHLNGLRTKYEEQNGIDPVSAAWAWPPTETLGVLLVRKSDGSYSLSVAFKASRTKPEWADLYLDKAQMEALPFIHDLYKKVDDYNATARCKGVPL